MPKRNYPSLSAYYEEDVRREQSREVDCGVLWTTLADFSPQWRVTWVEKTGEVYAYNQRRGAEEKLVVIGIVEEEEELERLIAGYAERCGQPGELKWIVDKLQHTLGGLAEFETVEPPEIPIIRF
jgi:hypothetical protein